MQTKKNYVLLVFLRKIIKELHLMNQQPQANRVVLSLSLSLETMFNCQDLTQFSVSFIAQNTRRNIACHFQHCHLMRSLSLPIPFKMSCLALTFGIILKFFKFGDQHEAHFIMLHEG